MLAERAHAIGSDVETEKAISAGDTIMTRAFGRVRSLMQVGRSFYSEGRAYDLGRGAEAWTGFYQTLCMCEMGPLLNVLGPERHAPAGSDRPH